MPIFTTILFYYNFPNKNLYWLFELIMTFATGSVSIFITIMSNKSWNDHFRAIFLFTFWFPFLEWSILLWCMCFKSSVYFSKDMLFLSISLIKKTLLNVASATFLLVCFISLKETCEITKKKFISLRNLFSFLRWRESEEVYMLVVFQLHI